ncbi:STAS-like domain-containing protein [Methyloglobulus sp.]|uniref:STAS-like domain-containing protein n=1 Tax=Methyloglobulus sp. TaxID=2518622 RepID=UPI0032B82126
MSNKTICIAKDYSDTPAGRYISDGNFSGERFREEFLYPALKENELVEVDLDEALGYGSSFLEEAFGGLIRVDGLQLSEIKNKLKVISSRSLYKNRIWKYLEDAALEKNKSQ